MSEQELAALETEIFGDDCARGPDGRPLERGAGSKYAKLVKEHPEKAAHLDALEALAVAEQEAAAAQEKLDAALARVAAARSAVETLSAPKVSEGPKLLGPEPVPQLPEPKPVVEKPAPQESAPIS